MSDPKGQKAYWADHYKKNAERKKANARRRYDEKREICRQEHADYYQRNKAASAARGKVWREVNGDSERERKRQRRLLLGDAIRAKRREHYRNNKHRYVALANLRREHIARATPKWADLESIIEVYRICRETSTATGVRHVVDHIIPLNGKSVCGLHVASNLQVLTADENTKKSNYFDPEQFRECLTYQPAATPSPLLVNSLAA